MKQTLFYDFKEAKILLNVVSLRWSSSHMTHMLYDNLYANSDTQGLKLQGLSLPQKLFYDYKVAKIFLNIVSLRWS